MARAAPSTGAPRASIYSDHSCKPLQHAQQTLLWSYNCLRPFTAPWRPYGPPVACPPLSRHHTRTPRLQTRCPPTRLQRTTQTLADSMSYRTRISAPNRPGHASAEAALAACSRACEEGLRISSHEQTRDNSSHCASVLHNSQVPRSRCGHQRFGVMRSRSAGAVRTESASLPIHSEVLNSDEYDGEHRYALWWMSPSRALTVGLLCSRQVLQARVHLDEVSSMAMPPRAYASS